MFDSEKVDFFCSTKRGILLFQYMVATLICLGFPFLLFPSTSLWIRISISVLAVISLLTFAIVNKSVAKGEFIAIQNDTIYIRTVNGKESIVMAKEIKNIGLWKGTIVAYELRLRDGKKIDLPGDRLRFLQAYNWIEKRIKILESE